jgi:hypothetical protein
MPKPNVRISSGFTLSAAKVLGQLIRDTTHQKENKYD